LWQAGGRELLERQEKDGLWTQDLFGRHDRHVGAAHGFAGNVLALSAAPEWLDDARAVQIRAVATASAFALVDGDVANWPVDAPGMRSGNPTRLQWCHGAAGVVTSLAGLAPDDDAHGALLTGGGELSGGLVRSREMPVSATAPAATASHSSRFWIGRATSAGSSAPERSQRTASTRSTASAQRLAAAATRSLREMSERPCSPRRA
jgi:hypothetical protein